MTLNTLRNLLGPRSRGRGKMPSKQETFDIVVSHLRKQGRRSIGVNGKCAYRSADGCQCAVGCLIPDDKYEAWMEGFSVYEHRIRDLIESLGHDASLCDSLQTIHDGYGVDLWESRFKAIAKDHDLAYTEPQP